MQNCIAHVLLYYIYSDRFFVHCTALTKQLQIVKGAQAPHLAIYSSSISRSPVAHRNMSTTRLYRYYRGKTNSYRGENFNRYIANDKISPIPISDFFKNILICVPKMNEGLTGFERHEGD